MIRFDIFLDIEVTYFLSFHWLLVELQPRLIAIPILVFMKSREWRSLAVGRNGTSLTVPLTGLPSVRSPGFIAPWRVTNYFLFCCHGNRISCHTSLHALISMIAHPNHILIHLHLSWCVPLSVTFIYNSLGWNDCREGAPSLKNDSKPLFYMHFQSCFSTYIYHYC